MVVISEAVPFTVSTDQTGYDHFTGLLKNNLVAVCPEDAFLVTLPLGMSENTPESFVSVFNDTASVKFGVVIGGILKATFNAHVTSEKELTGYLRRIRGYWMSEFFQESFPERMFVINGLPFDMEERKNVSIVACGSDDPSVVKAMGGALCGYGAAVPRFRKDEHGARRSIALRAGIVYGAAVLAAVAFLCTGALYGYNLGMDGKIADAKRRYNSILDGNSEIRDLIAEGDRISRKVLGINKHIVRPALWGPFLQTIGSLRPAGLYLDRLGSETAEENSVRIAFSGWCETETIATEFIKTLNGSPLLSNVTLSSIESEKTNSSIFRFKVLCRLSPQKK